MTTLAYRDGVLAADGLAARGDLVVERDHRKVRRLRDGSVVGVTGNPAPASPVIEWIEAGGGMSPPSTGNCCVVHLRLDGSLRVYEDGGWEDENPDRFMAWGSGWQIATTAMHYGATAEEAVRMAVKLDIYSGGKITFMALKKT